MESEKKRQIKQIKRMKRRKKAAYMLYHDRQLLLPFFLLRVMLPHPLDVRPPCWLKQVMCQAVTCFGQWKVSVEALWARLYLDISAFSLL